MLDFCLHVFLGLKTWTCIQEIIQEQITRVLLERLIVNRPHPWGLLITFIELIKVIRPCPLCSIMCYLFGCGNELDSVSKFVLFRILFPLVITCTNYLYSVFIMQNPRYNFWSHSFTRCAPEIEKLFESVARSCMGPPLKPSDDDLTASLGAEGLKN
jgi:CCR4-NOT transcription complex subunit 1